eukprot:gene5211-5449_t
MPPDSTPQGADEYYWVPAQPITPASIAQRRATGRLESALETVLLGDGAIREQLVNKFGLNIHQVQLAKDRRTVFILWDAHQGMAAACANALQHHAFKLRRDLAKVLNSKHTPFLEFRHDHLPPLKAAVAATIEQVERELASEATATDEAINAAESAASGLPSAAAVEAAIARLEAITAPREQQGSGHDMAADLQEPVEEDLMDTERAWGSLEEAFLELQLLQGNLGKQEEQQQQHNTAGTGSEHEGGLDVNQQQEAQLQ